MYWGVWMFVLVSCVLWCMAVRSSKLVLGCMAVRSSKLCIGVYGCSF